MKAIYYYIVMTQKNLLKNQVLEELLREKSNNYQVNKQQKDFWIVNSPNFLTKLNLEDKICFSGVVRLITNTQQLTTSKKWNY